MAWSIMEHPTRTSDITGFVADTASDIPNITIEAATQGSWVFVINDQSVKFLQSDKTWK